VIASARRIQFALLALILALPGMLSGQQVFGSIYGTVTDPSGAGVPNAKITISDQEKGTTFTVSSNESGNYLKDRLIPGVYTVEAEGAGFRKAVTKDLRVSVDQGSRLDLNLQLGAVTDSVEVVAAGALLQADRADVAVTFESRQLKQLPSFDRNLQSYILLTPGTLIDSSRAILRELRHRETVFRLAAPASSSAIEDDGLKALREKRHNGNVPRIRRPPGSGHEQNRFAFALLFVVNFNVA